MLRASEIKLIKVLQAQLQCKIHKVPYGKCTTVEFIFGDFKKRSDAFNVLKDAFPNREVKFSLSERIMLNVLFGKEKDNVTS